MCGIISEGGQIMWSTEIDKISDPIRHSFLMKLSRIFDEVEEKSNKDCRQDELLQKNLQELYQLESEYGLQNCEVSPSGKYHIWIIDTLCLLVSVNGFLILHDDWLFFDGELIVDNFQWIEEDNLVIFDLNYIIQKKTKKCICHFSENAAFVFRSGVEGEFCYF